MSIGSQIKKLRKEKKLSQEQLAKKCGLSRNSIYNYENEKRSPNSNDLHEIANALSVSINELVTEEEKQEIAKASLFEMASNNLKQDNLNFARSILLRFGLSAFYRKNDDKHVYISYKQNTYKIDISKYEQLCLYFVTKVESEITQLLSLLNEEDD